MIFMTPFSKKDDVTGSNICVYVSRTYNKMSSLQILAAVLLSFCEMVCLQFQRTPHTLSWPDKLLGTEEWEVLDNKHFWGIQGIMQTTCLTLPT